MKELLKNAAWSILAFFGILLVIGYVNNGYVGMKQMLADPFNWIIIGVVIVASYVIKLRRRNRELENPDPDL